MTSVMIATPAYGGQVTEPYFQSVLKTVFEANRVGLPVAVFTQSNESLITRARNNMVSTFLESQFDQLLWIDADIQFDPANVLRLVNSPYEVTATAYPLKGVYWDAVAGDTAEAKQASSKQFVVNRVTDVVDDNGFAEVYDAGTGFMCIKRSALEKMVTEYPELEYRADDGGLADDQRKRYLFFDTMLDTMDDGVRYLSEDYAFCRRWQNIGGKVMLDTKGPALGHRGSYTY